MKKFKINLKNYSKNEINLLKQEVPALSHISSEIITNEAIIYDSTGNIIAVYLNGADLFSSLAEACEATPFPIITRVSGLKTKTVTINASARSYLEYKCRKSSLKLQFPEIHDQFIKAGRPMAMIYRTYFKKQFAEQVKKSYGGADQVDKNYLIYKTPYTSAVVNKDSALAYHYDSSNTPDGISCMTILTKDIDGGELILPELNLGFACQNGYVLLFDGQKYLHGVTSIVNLTAASYRYTIVYYNNKGMALCLAPDQEELNFQYHLDKQAEKSRAQSGSKLKADNMDQVKKATFLRGLKALRGNINRARSFAKITGPEVMVFLKNDLQFRDKFKQIFRGVAA